MSEERCLKTIVQHDDLAAIPAGEQCSGNGERLGHDERVHTALRIHGLELRTFLRIGGRVFVHLPRQIEHNEADNDHHRAGEVRDAGQSQPARLLKMRDAHAGK